MQRVVYKQCGILLLYKNAHVRRHKEEKRKNYSWEIKKKIIVKNVLNFFQKSIFKKQNSLKISFIKKKIKFPRVALELSFFLICFLNFQLPVWEFQGLVSACSDFVSRGIIAYCLVATLMKINSKWLIRVIVEVSLLN